LLDRAFAEPVEATHRLPLWTLQLSLLQRRGSTARAVELAPAILREVPEGAGFDALRARALNTAARAAAQSGDARAAEWLAAALASAERAGDLGQQGYGLRTRAFLRELEGDRAGALIAVESALTTLAAVRDAQAPELFSVRSHRVHLLLAVGRRAEALVEAEAISAAAASLRKEHPAAIYTEVIRALALLNNGRKDEALVLAGVTAERCLSSLGALHAHCGSALHVQGRALVELARAGEALPILREALANREATMGAAHPYSAQVRGLLARAMCAAGEGEAASLHATVGSDEDVPRTMTACGGLDAGEGAAVADGE
jgi:hypothetical protein